jgi:hypothetical protein
MNISCHVSCPVRKRSAVSESRLAVVTAREPRRQQLLSGCGDLNARRKAMSDSGEFAAMNDPDLLTERRRVHEELQELTERYRELNQEFDRRARAAWAPTS